MAKKKRENMFAGKARRAMEKSKTSFGYLKIPEDINVFKPEGDTEVIMDIIPYIVTDESHLDNREYPDIANAGDPHWKRPIKVHKGVGPDNASVICPTTIGRKCPICEYFTKRRRAGDDWDDIRDYMPSNRTLYAVILTDASDCEEDYTEGEIHVMDQPDYYFGKALQAALDKDISAEGFADPEDGLSLRVDFREAKFGKVKFAEAIKVKFLDREEQYDDEIMEEAPDLDSMMKILPYKEIDAMFYGDMEGGEDDDDEDDLDDNELEEEKPARKSRKSRSASTSRRSSRKKDDDDDDDDDDERPTRRSRTKKDDDEEKPTRRSRAKKTEPEEEPEEEKPARRSRAKKEDTEEEKPARRSRAKKEEPVEEPEPEEEPEEEKPARKSRAKKEEGKKCPFGHKFGVEHDEFEDCDKCKIWEDCKDAN